MRVKGWAHDMSYRTGWQDVSDVGFGNYTRVTSLRPSDPEGKRVEFTIYRADARRLKLDMSFDEAQALHLLLTDLLVKVAKEQP